MAHAQALALAPEKENQHDCGNQNVHAEECADAVGEEVLHEESQRHSMLRNKPGDKLRVRKDNPKDTKQQVHGFAFHANFFH